MRYLKTYTVEAAQWWKPGDHPAVLMVPYWTVRRMVDNSATPEDALVPIVRTLEGTHYVTPGDWIITGQAGEHYACKPDIFAATYEPAP
jgi:hypothetical protein